MQVSVIPMSFPVAMEYVCQNISSVMTLMTVETTVMKRDVVCMWCEIWFNDPAPFTQRLLVIKTQHLSMDFRDIVAS